MKYKSIPIAFSITAFLSRVLKALEENNSNAGGGSITHGAEQRLIRGEGLVSSLDDIATIVLDMPRWHCNSYF